jgi:hypothetical protein
MLQAWRDGGSPIPAVEAMIDAGEREQAIVFARGMVEVASAEDKARLLQILDELVGWPPEWEAVLDDIANEPTLEKWEALHRFASGAAIYDWRRMAFRKLRERGTDPVMLFRFVSTGGILPDVFELVDDGLVPPEILIERANEPGAARSTWLGMAAQATFLRGDHVGTVRLLTEAEECETEWTSPIYSVLWLADRADDGELRAVLDRMVERHR